MTHPPSSAPERVLLVDHAEALGGAEHSLLLLLRYLDRARYEPILACNPGPLAAEAQKRGAQVELVPMARLRGEVLAPYRLARGVSGLCRVIRQHQVDLVYSNVVRSSIYAALAARCARRPLLWHVRDILAPGRYVRWMARRATATIAVSRAAAEPLPSHNSVHVIPNGVDLEAFDATAVDGKEVRHEWDVPAEAPLVGMVGRLNTRKGHRDFLIAAARIREVCPTARFVIIGGAIFAGETGYEDDLRHLAIELGLSDALIMAGHRSDLPAALAALDLLVHCSTLPESFGRVVIEGMAARLPIVAYDHGGPSEILSHGRTGILSPAGAPEALADRVLELLDQPDLARALGAAAREHVEHNYDARAVARQVEQVLAEALRGSS